MPTQAKPMDKKSYKEEFLEMIKQKAGLLTAIRMEEALKNDSKQMKEAQIDNGVPLEGIAQTQQLDLNKLLGTKAPEPQQLSINPNPASPPEINQEPTYTEKPASSPFGFGGYSIDAQNNVTRQKPGFIGAFLGGSNAEKDQLQNALLLQRLLTGQSGIEVQAEQRRQSAEARRMAQNREYNLRTFGGVVNEKNLQDPEYGMDLNATIEAYGIPARVNSQTGERQYSIPPMDVLRKRAEQMQVTPQEEEFFNTTFDAMDTTKEVLAGLQELGIEDPSKVGKIIPETIMSEFGPFSIPAKFNLAGQYAKDPKYTAMKVKLERVFQKYRKMITGAQASYTELALLRPLIASFTQRPEVFFATANGMIEESERMVNTRLELMDSIGRNTTKLKGLVQKRSGNVEQAATQEVPEVGQMFNGQKVLKVRRIK